MDFKLTTDGLTADMTWDKADSILNNLWLSLAVEQGTFFARPSFGMRSLRGEKLTARTVELARQYAVEAVQWVIDIGRATDINIQAEADKSSATGRIELLVAATQADGRQVSFEKFVEVV